MDLFTSNVKLILSFRDDCRIINCCQHFIICLFQISNVMLGRFKSDSDFYPVKLNFNKNVSLENEIECTTTQSEPSIKIKNFQKVHGV